ncbi:MAG: gliding motility-associated C-terminal domain-containing protein, partial [Flavobacteriales bacterium]|nr:gliding motility-associated C-terminal domain-containing protein [Flavobacteriales bacterium]
YAQGGLYDVQLTTINDKGCVDVLVQPVYVYLEPEPTVLFNAPCEKTAMTFDDGTQLDSGFVVSWDWDIAGLATDSVSSTSFTFDTSGFYDITLSVVTDHGCDGITTQTIFIKPIPSSEAGLDTSICPGEMITIGGSLTSGYAYDWDPSTGLNSPLVASPTLVLSNDSNVWVMHTYTVTTSLNGCSSSDTVDIGVFPSINPTLPVQEEQCWPNNRFFFEAAGVFSPNAVLTWDFGDGNVLVAGDTISHHYDTLGNSDTVRSYTVTLTVEDNGCMEVTSVDVQVFLVPVATFSIEALVGCQPFSVDFVAVSSNPAIDDSQLTFAWNFDDTASGALNLDTGQVSNHTYNIDGDYQPTLTITLGGCSKFEQMTQSLTVSVLPMPKAGLQIDPPVASVYDPVVNIIDMSQGADSCWLMVENGTWMDVCGYVQNYYDPNASFDDTVTHYITQAVKNSFGCVDTFRVSIDVLPAYIFFAPNSFTPNGDGINDLFFGRGFGIKDFEMLIYNRWGDLIWFTKDRFEGWDGIANVGEREAQQGIYVYLVNIVDIYDVPHEVVGKVVIIR